MSSKLNSGSRMSISNRKARQHMEVLHTRVPASGESVTTRQGRALVNMSVLTAKFLKVSCLIKEDESTAFLSSHLTKRTQAQMHAPLFGSCLAASSDQSPRRRRTRIHAIVFSGEFQRVPNAVKAAVTR